MEFDPEVFDGYAAPFYKKKPFLSSYGSTQLHTYAKQDEFEQVRWKKSY